MATAAALNAAATIISGHGLAVNANLLSSITTYQSKSGYTILSTIYSNANTYGNVANVIVPVLDTIGANATQAQFLIDIYPSNISPVTLQGATVNHRFGSNLISASGTILNQAQGAFAYGMAGFANVISITQGYASSAFDTIASISMLRTKTYGTSGLGYTGLSDLVTGGIGNNAALLGEVISGWGTMYNITNINLITDPYVFGQNLLDQGFGSYGSLANNLAATGLDVVDITRVPSSGTSVTQTASTLTSQTIVGAVDLPTVANVVTITTVTGNSPGVVVGVYQTVTGANLAAIVAGTGFSTNSNIQTLADLLDFNKVVNPSLLSQLNSIGITNFTQFTDYLNARVGQSTFTTWGKLADFLTTVAIPTLTHTTTTSSTPVLLSSTISTFSSTLPSGSGPFGNPIMVDFLGAVSGTPYNTNYGIINGSYNALIPTVYSALQAVNLAVSQVNAGYLASAPGDDANCVVQDSDVTSLISAVSGVDSAMNALSGTTLSACQTAYYQTLNSLTTEVINLGKAGAVFGSAPASITSSFGQRIGNLGASDASGLGVDTFIANLITDDAYGDTIQAVIAETNNTGTLGQAGITLKNDPNPRNALSEAKTQNISLSTYLSQNK